MLLHIDPFLAKGTAWVPASKSLSHRYLICAALAKNVSGISNVIECDDIAATRSCLDNLGKEKDFFCNESASTLRFLVPLSLVFSDRASFFCGSRLLERGIGEYEKIFSKQGISFQKENNRIVIIGKLQAGKFVVSGNESSQYASGLLFALPLLAGDSVLKITTPVVSRPYLDLTLLVLKQFGIKIEERKPFEFFVKGSQRYLPQKISIEGDWTNGAVLHAFNLVDGSIKVKGLDDFSTQGDKICLDFFARLKKDWAEIDLTNFPDLAPVMFAVAAMLHGGKFLGTERLQKKESDRLHAMIAELKKFGIKTEEGENFLTVYPAKLAKPQKIIEGHHDHRIVMAMFLLLSKTGGILTDIEAVNKSWPTFFDVMQGVGAKFFIKA